MQRKTSHPGSPKSRLFPQKVVSYTTFVAKEKAKLKSAYPFLSADQINRKIKDQWKHMAQGQKQNYTKIALKITPTKDNKKSTDRKRKIAASSGSVKLKKAKIDVNNTPEIVNTRKLSDFRKLYSETYKNDFSDTSLDSASFSTQSNEKLRSDITEPLHETPAEVAATQQPGILKFSSCSEKKAGEGRVSFYSPAEIHLLSQDDHNCVYDGFEAFGDSDDNSSSLLIRRYSEETNIQDANTKSGHHDDDDDAEDDAVLIRRDDLNCGDKVGMEMEEDQNPETDEIMEQNDGKLNIEKKTTVSKERNMKSEEKYEKKVKNDGNYDGNGNTTSDDYNVTDSHGEVLFKSPLPGKNKRNRKKKNLSRRKNKNLSQTPTLPLQEKSQVTPVVHGISSSSSDVNTYTTPQMDEVLQQLTMSNASKAPQKRRQSQEGATVQKKMDSVSGRRVTRSLLSLNGKINKKNTDEQEQLVEMTGTVKEEFDKNVGFNEETVRKSQKKTRRKNNARVPNDNRSTADRMCIQMNPSGAASQGSPGQTGNTNLTKCTGTTKLNKTADGISATNTTANEYAIYRKIESTKKLLSDSPKDSGESSQGSMYRKRAVLRELPFSPMLASGEGSQGSILDMCVGGSDRSRSSSCSVASPVNWSYQKCSSNPALEKALRNLKCSGLDSPTMPVHGESEVSSPRLLSPALSGVSEFSSVSSGATADYDDRSNINPGVNTDRDLCQMFQDVTPPDKKTKGLYKTNRMLASNVQQDSRDFKQLFKDDKDFLFS